MHCFSDRNLQTDPDILLPFGASVSDIKLDFLQRYYYERPKFTRNKILWWLLNQCWYSPGWCAARMSARESKGPLPAYEQLCTSCKGVCWLYAWPEGPTPAGWAFRWRCWYCASDCRRTGPRDAAPSLVCAYCNGCGGPIRQRHIPSAV